MAKFATSELVTMCWLRGLGLQISGVSTTLPEDYLTWANNPYVLVEGVVGGGINVSTTQKQPIVTLGIYAVSVKSGGTGLDPKPPYKAAAEVAEEIIRETIKFSQYWREETPVTLPTGYEKAWIQEVYPVTDARRRPGDQGAYAVYDVDMQILWSSAVPN